MRRRRALAATTAALALAVSLAAAPAGAVGLIVGFTWYSDGEFSKTGVSGQVVVAYATQAKANTQYRMQYAPSLPTGEGCPEANKVSANPNVRLSNGSGFIGNTAGTITGAPGVYQLCFYEVGAISASATTPVYFSIL